MVSEDFGYPDRTFHGFDLKMFNVNRQMKFLLRITAKGKDDKRIHINPGKSIGSWAFLCPENIKMLKLIFLDRLLCICYY